MTPAAPWRVVIATRVPYFARAFDEIVRDAGHEPVALLSVLDLIRRYGRMEEAGELVFDAPPHLDVLIPARRRSIAPLLEAVRPDLVVCMGFPWKVPAAALAVPALGWLNGHPSPLPRRRGPTPFAWAIREGDPELGMSWHRMDAELDTGPVLAQRTYPAGPPGPPEELFAKRGDVVLETLAEALERLAAGDEGVRQEGGDYQGFFGADDARLDLSRPADELNRLVWAWRYAFAPGVVPGPLLELDGRTVRVLASSLEERDGARRVDCADGPLWLLETEPVEPAQSA